MQGLSGTLTYKLLWLNKGANSSVLWQNFLLQKLEQCVPYYIFCVEADRDLDVFWVTRSVVKIVMAIAIAVPSEC